MSSQIGGFNIVVPLDWGEYATKCATMSSFGIVQTILGLLVLLLAFMDIIAISLD